MAVLSTEQINTALQKTNLNCSEKQLQQFTLYFEKLQHWNRKYNLTAIVEPNKILSHHLLDSLSVVPYLMGQQFLDLGTGGGLPGVVLAIALAEKQFTLLDARAKKTHFLTQVTAELALSNVNVVHARAQEFSAQPLFDGIICRAVGRMNEVIVISRHLIATQGVWYFMK